MSVRNLIFIYSIGFCGNCFKIPSALEGFLALLSIKEINVKFLVVNNLECIGKVPPVQGGQKCQ
jgi:hypothetical protein